MGLDAVDYYWNIHNTAEPVESGPPAAYMNYKL